MIVVGSIGDVWRSFLPRLPCWCYAQHWSEQACFPSAYDCRGLRLVVRLLTVGKFVGVPAVLADRHLSSTSLTATHSQVAQYQRYFQVLRQRRGEIRQWLGDRRVNGGHICIAV